MHGLHNMFERKNYTLKEKICSFFTVLVCGHLSTSMFLFFHIRFLKFFYHMCLTIATKCSFFSLFFFFKKEDFAGILNLFRYLAKSSACANNRIQVPGKR